MESSNGNSSNQCPSSGAGNPSGSSAEEAPEEEEPSSSSSQTQSELDKFRLQWKQELSVKNDSVLIASDANQAEESIEEKAKFYFLLGVKAERTGKLQDAISFYRRAIQLVPDIEFRIGENCCDYDRESIESSDSDDNFDDTDCEENQNLLQKFQKLSLHLDNYRICLPKHEQLTSHISCLPHEIFIYILKWVVSQELDVVSLEQISKVCRGFYICARDNEIWKLICSRTWDVCNDTPNRYGSWRNMFIQRPHLSFNGVYISKTTYVRYGDPSFTDANYRPCYIVVYYRYLRFFPDGDVLMLTTPEDPYQAVAIFRCKKSKHSNILLGRYKLIGNTVVAVLRKQKWAENASQPVQNFFVGRRNRQANMQEVVDQTFHLELQVKNVRRRVNCQLTWNRYSIHMVYRNGEEAVSNFDITPSTFPSFWFSRVKSYAAESESLLM